MEYLSYFNYFVGDFLILNTSMKNKSNNFTNKSSKSGEIECSSLHNFSTNWLVLKNISHFLKSCSVFKEISFCFYILIMYTKTVFTRSNITTKFSSNTTYIKESLNSKNFMKLLSHKHKLQPVIIGIHQ